LVEREDSMDMQRRLAGVGTVTLLASLTLAAKCPPPVELPPGHGGRDAGVRDAGHGDRHAIDAGGGRDGGSAGGTGGLSACSGSDPNGIWTTEHPDLPVTGLAALAPNDIWLSTSDSVQHWDGISWTPMLTRTTGTPFGPIWASGPTDVWVAGDEVRRWDGTTWIDTMFPISDPIAQLWGSGPNDVWIVATRQFETANPVYHWTGAGWVETGAASGLADLGAQVNIYALWGPSSNDVWGFGLAWTANTPTFSAAVLRWRDGQWQAWGDLVDPGRASQSFLGASGAAPDDIWLTGYDGLNGAALWHFDGAAIVKVAGFSPLGVSGFPWASCAHEVWFPVTDGRRALLARYRSGTSALVELPGSAAYVVSGIRSGEIWSGGHATSGDGGALFHLHSTADTQPVCGDVRMETGEQCDPPNGVTCDQSCQRIPTCGDGFVDPGEQCDPPVQYVCSASCLLLPTCGNGRVDPGEDCDPPRSWPYPQCDQTCHVVACGNGQVDPGEQCDPPREGPGNPTPWCDSNCQIPTCGNGQVDPGETCDPPDFGWLPGHASPNYCGNDCTTHDACVECHQVCDGSSLGFSACERQACAKGPYLPCGT
jgi:hypothetical protein